VSQARARRRAMQFDIKHSRKLFLNLTAGFTSFLWDHMLLGYVSIVVIHRGLIFSIWLQSMTGPSH